MSFIGEECLLDIHSDWFRGERIELKGNEVAESVQPSFHAKIPSVAGAFTLDSAYLYFTPFLYFDMPLKRNEKSCCHSFCIGQRTKSFSLIRLGGLDMLIQ